MALKEVSCMCVSYQLHASSLLPDLLEVMINSYPDLPGHETPRVTHSLRDGTGSSSGGDACL